MLTDTHCHLFKEYYNDIFTIIEKANNNNVKRFITSGCDNLTNQEVYKIAQKYENIYGTLGIHPESVDEYNESDLKFIEENILNPKIVAIGEIGLDYYYKKDNKEKQLELFNKQLMMAEKYNKPVVIHSRNATEDTINTLKKYKLKGVIHSFSGSVETAKEYIKLGYLLGINGVVTFKNSNLKDIFEEISFDNIILETDSPYLTPEPYRGQKNEPSHIKDVAEYLCNLKGIDISNMEMITENNIKRVFGI